MHKLLCAREYGEEVHGLDDVLSERWTTLQVDESRKFTCSSVNTIRSVDLDSPAGQLLLFGGQNFVVGGTVGVHKYPEQNCKPEKEPLDVRIGNPSCDGVRCIRWFPSDRALFLTGSNRRFNGHNWAEVHIWDTEAFKSISSFRMDEPGVRAFDLSDAPDARQELIATVLEESHDVRLLDIASGANTHRLEGHHGPVTDVKWAPSNPHMLVSCDEDGMICLFDVRRSGHHACLLRFDYRRRLHESEPRVSKESAVVEPLISLAKALRSSRKRRRKSVQELPTAALLGLGCSWTSNSRQRSLQRGIPYAALSRGDSFRPARRVRFTMDGAQVISVSKDTSFRAWDVITGKLVSEFHDVSLRHTPVIAESKMELARDGIHMIWACFDSLRVVDLQDGMIVHNVESQWGGASEMIVHPLEEEIITVHQNHVDIWSYKKTPRESDKD